MCKFRWFAHQRPSAHSDFDSGARHGPAPSEVVRSPLRTTRSQRYNEIRKGTGVSGNDPHSRFGAASWCATEPIRRSWPPEAERPRRHSLMTASGLRRPESMAKHGRRVGGGRIERRRSPTEHPASAGVVAFRFGGRKGCAASNRAAPATSGSNETIISTLTVVWSGCATA